MEVLWRINEKISAGPDGHLNIVYGHGIAGDILFAKLGDRTSWTVVSTNMENIEVLRKVYAAIPSLTLYCLDDV